MPMIYTPTNEKYQERGGSQRIFFFPISHIPYNLIVPHTLPSKIGFSISSHGKISKSLCWKRGKGEPHTKKWYCQQIICNMQSRAAQHYILQTCVPRLFISSKNLASIKVKIHVRLYAIYRLDSIAIKLYSAYLVSFVVFSLVSRPTVITLIKMLAGESFPFLSSILSLLLSRLPFI